MSAVIDMLRHQHEEVLERIALAEDRFANAGVAGDFLDFLAGDVIRHFRLEEEVLFPELAQIRPLAAGPLRVMNAEHEAFRDLLRIGMEARERGDGKGVTSAAADLAALLRAHIAKEDGVLFPMALEQLTAEQVARMDAIASGPEGLG